MKIFYLTVLLVMFSSVLCAQQNQIKLRINSAVQRISNTTFNAQELELFKSPSRLDSFKSINFEVGYVRRVKSKFYHVRFGYLGIQQSDSFIAVRDTFYISSKSISNIIRLTTAVGAFQNFKIIKEKLFISVGVDLIGSKSIDRNYKNRADYLSDSDELLAYTEAVAFRPSILEIGMGLEVGIKYQFKKFGIGFNLMQLFYYEHIKGIVEESYISKDIINNITSESSVKSSITTNQIGKRFGSSIEVYYLF